MRVQKYKVVLSAKQRKRLKVLSHWTSFCPKVSSRPYPATGRPKPSSRAMNDNQIHQILNVIKRRLSGCEKSLPPVG